MTSHCKNVDITFLSANQHHLLHSLTSLWLLLQNILPKPSYSVPPFKQIPHLTQLTARGILGLLLLFLVVPVSHHVQTLYLKTMRVYTRLPLATVFLHNKVSINTTGALQRILYLFTDTSKTLCSSPPLTPLLTLTSSNKHLQSYGFSSNKNLKFSYILCS